MLTKEALQTLKQQGHSNAEIAKLYVNERTGKPLSREWVRRLCKQWDVLSYCSCGVEIKGMERRCVKCKMGLRKQRYRDWKEQHQTPRSFSNRPVVEEAASMFEQYGLDVEFNVLGGNSDPELLVEGKAVKCNVIIPVSKGHQTRVRPNEMATAFYLSDGMMWFLIPAEKITQQHNYIGESNALRKYSEEQYRREVMGSFRGK